MYFVCSLWYLWLLWFLWMINDLWSWKMWKNNNHVAIARFSVNNKAKSASFKFTEQLLRILQEINLEISNFWCLNKSAGIVCLHQACLLISFQLNTRVNNRRELPVFERIFYFIRFNCKINFIILLHLSVTFKRKSKSSIKHKEIQFIQLKSI